MKKLMLPMLILFVSTVFAQIVKLEKVTDYSAHIIGNKFEGVIFSEEYDLSLGFTKGKKFTPNKIDINKVEKLLILSLDTIQDQTNQIRFIKHHLRHYLRQYFGYTNEKGENVISINLFWKSPDNIAGQRWLKETFIVLDGGYYYWQIKFNLNESKFFDYSVNGEA